MKFTNSKMIDTGTWMSDVIFDQGSTIKYAVDQILKSGTEEDKNTSISIDYQVTDMSLPIDSIRTTNAIGTHISIRDGVIDHTAPDHILNMKILRMSRTISWGMVRYSIWASCQINQNKTHQSLEYNNDFSTQSLYGRYKRLCLMNKQTPVSFSDFTLKHFENANLIHKLKQK